MFDLLSAISSEKSGIFFCVESVTLRTDSDHSEPVMALISLIIACLGCTGMTMLKDKFVCLFVCFSSNRPCDSVCFPRAIVAVVAAGQWAHRRCAACSACQRCMFSHGTDCLDKISCGCGTLSVVVSYFL